MSVPLSNVRFITRDVSVSSLPYLIVSVRGGVALPPLSFPGGVGVNEFLLALSQVGVVTPHQLHDHPSGRSVYRVRAQVSGAPDGRTLATGLREEKPSPSRPPSLPGDPVLVRPPTSPLRPPFPSSAHALDPTSPLLVHHSPAAASSTVSTPPSSADMVASPSPSSSASTGVVNGGGDTTPGADAGLGSVLGSMSWGMMEHLSRVTQYARSARDVWQWQSSMAEVERIEAERVRRLQARAHSATAAPPPRSGPTSATTAAVAPAPVVEPVSTLLGDFEVMFDDQNQDQNQDQDLDLDLAHDHAENLHQVPVSAARQAAMTVEQAAEASPCVDTRDADSATAEPAPPTGQRTASTGPIALTIGRLPQLTESEWIGLFDAAGRLTKSEQEMKARIFGGGVAQPLRREGRHSLIVLVLMRW
jgi:hypothetical protein